MIQKLIIAFLILTFITISQQRLPLLIEKVYSSNERVLAEHSMSLGIRYPNKMVNEVFKDNILLNFAYLSGKVTNASTINWDEVRTPSRFELTLQPGEVFAFHDDVLPSYQGRVIKTTHAHFNSQEGFKSDGYLVGDGVCHFASLINWAARDAGLTVVAPTNHDFATIPQVAREYGTSIYYSEGQSAANEQQNLYVENTTNKPVRMVFRYENNELSLAIYSEK